MANAENVEDLYPLSPMQQGMLFQCLDGADAKLYVEQVRLELDGLEPDAFRRAWEHVAARHPPLRTSIAGTGLAEPAQVVHRRVGLPWRELDWRALAPEARNGERAAFLEHDARQGVALREPPLMRFALIRTGEARYELVWTLHHIALDGWSASLVLQDVLQCYGAFRRGAAAPELPARRPFRDYVAWLRAQELADADAYFEQALAGFEPPRPLGAAGAGHAVARYAEHAVALPPQATDALRRRAAALDLTLHTLVEGAWALLLARYGGADDLVLGSVVSGRPDDLHGASAMVGMFVNTLPLRVQVPGAQPAADWLRGLQQRRLAQLRFQHMPLWRVQQRAGVPAGTPLFESLLAFEGYGVARAEHRVGDLTVRVTPPFDRTGVPLLLVAIPGERLELRLTYDAERFEADEIARWAGELGRRLPALAEQSERPLAAHLALGADERELVVSAWNATAAPRPAARCLHELVAAQVAARPDATAVDGGAETLSYAALAERSHRLARVLQQRGVGRDDVVALCLERSVDLVVAVLAVLEAGAGYLPLDPALPDERLAFVLRDAGPRVVVAHDATRARAEAVAGGAVLCLGRDRAAIDAQRAEPPPCPASPRSLAYVLYTSGSTGVPKGVLMPHAPLVALIGWQLGASRCGAGARTLQYAPLGFDVSCQEIFATLAAGGTLVLIDEEARRDPVALLAHLRARAVERLFVPAVALQQLAECAQARDEPLPPLREVITAGEQLQVGPAVAALFARLDGCTLVNQYGPTECHVVSSFTLPADPAAWPRHPPIGRPIANTRLYVLDADLQPVPPGAPGELCIGGAAVGRGYAGDAAQTARAFVPDPFADEPGMRLYRTGDLARARAGGELEFLGRLDEQVKLRGFRVEPGEIESVLAAHPRVRRAAAVVREDRAGDRRLVAYVVPGGAADSPADGGEALRGELRAYAAGRLPDWMVPSAFVMLREVPLTRSGKIDRRALARPEHAPRSLHAPYVPPRDAVEETLAALFAEVLGAGGVGAHDDFFDLGGHSLLATRLVARARDVLQVELPQRDLFAHRTVAALAEAVRARRAGARQPAPPLRRAPRQGPLPLSPAQQRLWFVDQMGSGAAYNMPWAFRLEGDLDALQASLEAVVARHEPLRTTFRSEGGVPVQVIEPPAELPLPLDDLSQLAPQARAARLDAIAADEARTPFDLRSGPIFRPRVVRLAPDEHVLFLSVHHIAFDGWSIGVLNRELHALYRAFAAARANGAPPPAALPELPELPELPIRYADFAAWQNEWMRGPVLDEQLGYWRAQLAGLAELALPTDRPRPPVQAYEGAAVPLALSPALVRRLELLSRRNGVTLAMTLLAAFKALLMRCSGQVDIAVGSPIANRTRSELEGLIGFFVNALVLRTDLSGDPSFGELLRRVQATSLAAYEHQDLPFERLVDELQPERDQRKNPLFQVVFAMQNTPGAPLELPRLRIAPLEAHTRMTRFDLELHLAQANDAVTGGFCYNVALFDRSTVERLAARFALLLEGAVADPARPISQLPVLLDTERRLLLEEWNDPSAAFPAGCLHALLERQVDRTPDATALVHGGTRLTYRELDERANRLAHALRARGVQPDDLVAVCLERGIDLVVAIVAILKAGAAYVPLDLANPRERIAFILEDAAVRLVVTESAQLDGLPSHAAEVLCVDRESAAIAAQSAARPSSGAQPHHAAYVIYTSGSTGVPKGVVVEHRSVARLFPATAHWFGFGPSDCWTLFHSCAFDFSVWEIWGALLHGGTLVVVPLEVARAPDELWELLVRERVTVLNQTPSAFRQLIAAEPARRGAAHALRWVIFGGEALDLQSLRPWFERHGDGQPRLANMYGITETTVHITWRELRPRDLHEAPGSVIGVPIPDLQVHVLDRHMQPVPIGIPGEVWVGGAGVARGYLRRPELTAERFVDDPFRAAPDARLYRTGDVARWLASRDLEYLGRNDEQVKIRGFRIELGEVEAAIRGHPWIRDTVVTARDGPDGTRQLVAYVVPDGDGARAEEGDVVAQWATLYDETYAEPAADGDPTFDITGWNSSYTSEPIPRDEMRAWLEAAVARIMRAPCRRVLEIGCGTGMLLFRIAPHCERYVGTDSSGVALDGIRRHLPADVAPRVELLQRGADDFSGLAKSSFDTVVLNSVVQYFPSVGYLLQVLEGAAALVAPGGRIVLGDVRDLRTLEALHASVEVFRAADDAPAAELRAPLRQRIAQEEELVLDPRFFAALAGHVRAITHVEVEPKRGRARNELTRFRYEVTLYVGDGAPAPAAEPRWLDWREDALSEEKLDELLRAGPALLGVRRIPNARIGGALRLADALLREEPDGTAAELRARVAADDGVDPEALCALAERAGYTAVLSLLRADAGDFDALLAPADAPRSRFPLPRVPPRPWGELANQPLQARMTRQLAPKLRERLSAALPDYMVPSAFVMLGSLPLTANGKVDRRALPEPEWLLTQRQGAFVAPRTPTERAIAEIWSELLGADRVSLHDDFFDLGGHSLLATQVVSRLRDAFAVELQLRQLFEAPTIAEIAELVDGLRWARDGREAPPPAAASARETGDL